MQISGVAAGINCVGIMAKLLFFSTARQLQRGTRLQAREIKTLSACGMSILEFKGSWNIAKGKLKQRVARLTDDEQQFVEGKEDELVGRIQKRTIRAHKMTVETSSND